MRSAPGLRGLYPRPERRGFTPLLVSGLHRPTFEAIALRVAHVTVVRGEFCRAAQHRIVHADAGAPAVNEAVTRGSGRIADTFRGELVDAGRRNAAAGIHVDELIFKVLSESNDFKAAVKRVVAAQGVGVAVVRRGRMIQGFTL